MKVCCPERISSTSYKLSVSKRFVKRLTEQASSTWDFPRSHSSYIKIIDNKNKYHFEKGQESILPWLRSTAECLTKNVGLNVLDYVILIQHVMSFVTYLTFMRAVLKYNLSYMFKNQLVETLSFCQLLMNKSYEKVML